ncbi:tRNA (adenosine(37)-N6)-threonylcarbamoyltransferase complex dimerization subunit type 1 TsaB [Buchnera aphidicola (Acyrthosiphon lactucae)]|uniref:tRNA threonylcarbamoyladenosine biosynthesis protein TsaB n=1 Tax=Buchnera aphidicola (Acyrthosiphon lactucae) TaxID=1241832 RepID=A0A4D6XTF1_9GAMM|nr:tRNA (adenosine(37)-N6)-threonylcarbamoyltransferase complex dimerization subunit type 1 TsaB [Buchnera aphidicola]QCI17720.1 tRNA (adenosine(37)-N6)-threonylcarbamoyltransferase complex dimerization subunit type 1 TsaB [Buchnera aphidicola (Acyrthosiphon lactucae)]
MSNIILAIDSSINCCSIAIYKNKYIYSLSEKCEKQHTTKILPMIQKILFQTKTKFDELDYISFSKGPGNFTSIRIAASIAQSLSFSLNIPIISISTLAIMAEKAWRKYKKKQIIVVINAKKTEVYWAKYIRNKKSIWIGEHTESLLKKKLIINEINNLKNKWTLVSNEWQLIEFKNSSNINKIKIFLPNAKDIIPFTLLKIRNKQLCCSEENSINYLYNTF